MQSALVDQTGAEAGGGPGAVSVIATAFLVEDTKVGDLGLARHCTPFRACPFVLPPASTHTPARLTVAVSAVSPARCAVQRPDPMHLQRPQVGGCRLYEAPLRLRSTRDQRRARVLGKRHPLSACRLFGITSRRCPVWEAADCLGRGQPAARQY